MSKLLSALMWRAIPPFVEGRTPWNDYRAHLERFVPRREDGASLCINKDLWWDFYAFPATDDRYWLIYEAQGM